MGRCPMWHERRQGIDRGCGQPISYNNNCLIHVQMTRDVHTVEALVIGSQCAPNWRVCSKRMQARCHEEILWQNLLLITNCHNLSLPPFPTQCHNTSHSDTLQVHITWPYATSTISNTPVSLQAAYATSLVWYVVQQTLGRRSILG